MIRNLKVLGLALVAMMALTAMAATAASAETTIASFHSDSSTGNTILTGEATGNHVFDAAGSTITCTGAKFEGTQTGNTAEDVTTSVSYSGCTVTVFGFKIAATVNMGGCAYTFNANGEVGVVNRAGATKTCAEENITYRVSNFSGECDVKVGPQTGLKSASYTGTTTSANSTINVAPNVTGIHGVAAGNLCTAGTFTNGAYTSGPATVKGYTDEAGAEGAQTAIWVTH
jgi:hypothetical protein